MDVKPIHFDGSIQSQNTSDSSATEPFKLTDEMRVNISGNPYTNGKVE